MFAKACNMTSPQSEYAALLNTYKGRNTELLAVLREKVSKATNHLDKVFWVMKYDALHDECVQNAYNCMRL